MTLEIPDANIKQDNLLMDNAAPKEKSQAFLFEVSRIL